MEALERLLAERACERLQLLYAEAADAGDVEGFTDLFVADGSISVPEHPPFMGHDAIRSAMQALADTGRTMRHLITNALIDVTDADHAVGTCRLLVYDSTALPDQRGIRPMLSPGTVGDFHDRFVRAGAQWRFSARSLVRIFQQVAENE
jgi:ketosteroid isomerase-like protein